jgi:putative nucleotidyltransferase with HDIG domain
MLDLATVLRKVRELPALPSVVLDLIESFDRADVDVATLAEKISKDQALAAKTLRLANSSFYGLSAKVRTVNQAIVVLGFDSARALAVAGGIIEGCRPERTVELDVTSFWRHSIAAALCARSLARRCHVAPDDAFIAGLLHDIGRLVLASTCPHEYAQVVAYGLEHDVSASQAEQRVLGFDHQRVGQLLAEQWKFPAVIQRAIAEHHRPAREALRQLGGVVHVANALVQMLDIEGDPEAHAAPVMDEVWEALALQDEQVKEICRETEMQFEEACKLLLSDEKNEKGQ